MWVVPVVLDEVFQRGELPAPISFRMLTRLLRRIVVLIQQDARLRSVPGQMHRDDVIIFREIGHAGERTEMAVLEHTPRTS